MDGNLAMANERVNMTEKEMAELGDKFQATQANLKAIELVNKFKPIVTTWISSWDSPRDSEDINNDAIKCAIICCDQIINSIVWHHDFNNEKRNFWKEVKNEIIKMP